MPLSPLDLAQPAQWFQDERIAALADDRELCTRVLTSPLVRAQAVDDKPLAHGCGWSTAVRLEWAAGAEVQAEPLSCPMAAGMTLWLVHVVQPAAERLLGKRVKALKTFGSYSCRGMVGNARIDRLKALGLPVPLSEHARANALDVAVFELADSGSVSVLKDWHGGGAKAEFLRAVHDGACGIFRVVLGPDANAAHANHFHLDRGRWHACR